MGQLAYAARHGLELVDVQVEHSHFAKVTDAGW